MAGCLNHSPSAGRPNLGYRASTSFHPPLGGVDVAVVVLEDQNAVQPYCLDSVLPAHDGEGQEGERLAVGVQHQHRPFPQRPQPAQLEGCVSALRGEGCGVGWC